MSLAGATQYMADALAAVPGTRGTPEKLRDAPASFPFVIVYRRESEYALNPGFANALTTLFAEVHFSRTLLKSIPARVTEYEQAFLQALLADPTLGGHVQALNGRPRSTFGGMQWGDVTTIGIRFEISVKIAQEVTT
jgi:hypothetical protein